MMKMLKDHLLFFTRIDMNEIKNLCKKDIRQAKELLAFEVTKLVHGKEEAEKARDTARSLFSGNILINDIPTKEINIDNDILLIDLLVLCSLAKSKTEAKRLILQNGIKIDGEKEKNIDKIIKISNREIVIQKVKKCFIKIRFVK